MNERTTNWSEYRRDPQAVGPQGSFRRAVTFFQAVSLFQMPFRWIGIVLVLTFTLSSTFAQIAPAKPVPCDRDPNYHKLDFWLGEWDVFDIKSGTKDGTNRIEKTLKGCAIIENWTESADGSEGKSLFYLQRTTGQWKQVWVEDSGGMKEKSLQESYAGPGVRFQGEILHKNGGSHLDRTTLQPLSGGRVRQTIEISRDSGRTWEVAYDAEYRRAK